MYARKRPSGSSWAPHPTFSAPMVMSAEACWSRSYSRFGLCSSDRTRAMWEDQEEATDVVPDATVSGRKPCDDRAELISCTNRELNDEVLWPDAEALPTPVPREATSTAATTTRTVANRRTDDADDVLPTAVMPPS